MTWDFLPKKTNNQQARAGIIASPSLKIPTLWLVMGTTSLLCAIIDSKLLGGMFYVLALVNFLVYFVLRRFFKHTLATAPRIGLVLAAVWAILCLAATLTFTPEFDWLDYKHLSSDGLPTQDVSHSMAYDRMMWVAIWVWLALFVWTLVSIIMKLIKKGPVR